MDIYSIYESLTNMPSWFIYIIIAVLPFIQEDAAVIGTAALAVMGKISLAPALGAILIGLFLSDAWKYWIGWAALKNKRGGRLLQKDKVLTLKEKVNTYPFTTLMAARFIPLTRIPAYVACGFFQIHYSKFCLYIALTACLYVFLVFSAMFMLGELLAERLTWALPVIGLIFVIIMTGFHYIKNSHDKSDTSDTK